MKNILRNHLLAFLISPILLITNKTYGSEATAPGNCNCYPPEVMQAFETIREFNTRLPYSICSVDPTAVRQVINRSKTAYKAGAFDKILQNNDIALVGEIHLYTDLKSRLEIIRKFHQAKGSNACVAFEWPRSEAGLSGILDTFKAMAAQDRKIGGDHIIRAENIDRMIAYYEPMGETAKSLGMKAITFDDKDRMEKELSIDDRNQSMSANLSSDIKSGKCSAVLAFVGKTHMTKNPDSESRLQDLLVRKGLKTVAVNLQMLNESTVPFEARSWADCASPKFLDRNFGIFSNSNLPDNPNLFSTSTPDTAKWKEFDYTFVSP